MPKMETASVRSQLPLATRRQIRKLASRFKGWQEITPTLIELVFRNRHGAGDHFMGRAGFGFLGESIPPKKLIRSEQSGGEDIGQKDGGGH
jgi:hypothetical protein